MILHVDMDCFFAQVEERENPRFKGKPIVVGADPRKGSGRGVVSTCNYKARENGVYSGMPISQAYKASPNAIFLPVNEKLYSRTSESIFSIIEGISKKYERVSFDEAYVDISEIARNYTKSKEVGKELKEMIFKKEKLICSVGIGENKMIAKIACESGKPNGLKLIKPNETSRFISKRKIRDIPGIGPKSEKILERFLGKKNLKVEDVRGVSKAELRKVFKNRGLDIYNKVRGIDKSVIEISKEAKSIGKEKTFQKDTTDSEEIIKTFKKLSKEISLLAKEKELLISKVMITCRFEGFKTYTRQTSFSPRKPSEELIYKKGIKLLLKLLLKEYRAIRLLGIRVLFEE